LQNFDCLCCWPAVKCIILPPLSLAIKSRSNVCDRSFYSLHSYPSFHLCKLFMVIFGSLLYLMVGYERIGPEFAITIFSEIS
jgi:hypothetical protein